MVGRLPRPAAEKELAGNPGGREIVPEPQPEALKGIPPAPEHLGEYGAELWRRQLEHADRLGIVAQIDLAGFEVFCETYNTWRTAQAKVRELGMVYERDGFLKLNPAQGIMDKAARALRVHMGEFGFSPSTRTRVSAAGRLGDQPTLPMPELQDEPQKPTRDVARIEEVFGAA